jgi:hypothetical protein
VRVTGGFVIRPRAGAVLAEGDEPLLWVYDGREIRAVVLPFALNQTDLPLHPAFPVLVANAIDWLVGRQQVSPGDAPVVPAGSRLTATLISPDGTTATITARDGVFALPPFDHVGPYRLRAGGWERRWVVPTIDSRESDLTVSAPAAPAAVPEAPQSAQVLLTPWLLGIAVALIACEWALWARTVPRGSAPVQRDGRLRERLAREERA